jgi:hypothetical protein
MQELCFLSNLTSSEWASWAQAVGTFAAIIGAAWVGRSQSRSQHRSALALFRAQQAHDEQKTMRTLAKLTTNCVKLVEHARRTFPDRQAVHEVADGTRHFDHGELEYVEGVVSGIPLHTLPDSLVTSAMIAASTMRQFRKKVEGAINDHRVMDGAAYDDFFRCLREMHESLSKTADEVAKATRSIASAPQVLQR